MCGMLRMFDKSQLWECLEPLIGQAGFALYEIDMPLSKQGVLRVFIDCLTPGAAAVSVDDCARLSKLISVALGNMDSYLAELSLEVSSPGINRKLSRPQHFYAACGQRIRLKTGAALSAPRLIVGKLLEFDGHQLQLQEESSGEVAALPLGDVREARVDFEF